MADFRFSGWPYLIQNRPVTQFEVSNRDEILMPLDRCRSADVEWLISDVEIRFIDRVWYIFGFSLFSKVQTLTDVFYINHECNISVIVDSHRH